MEEVVFCRELEEKARVLGVMLHEEQQKNFYDYMNLLVEWNKKINLTAITEPNDIIIKHFVDSLTILKYIEDGSTVVDIGTGAGFPGIPIKIANSNLDMVLVDSLNKRINFLNEVISNLGLKGITTVHSRVEDFARCTENREKYDVVTSRAVAKLSVLAEYMLPLLKVGGLCVCMKGAEVEDEIHSSRKAIDVLGGTIDMVDCFELLDTGMMRNVVVIKKIKNTPGRFPRKAGVPAKEPIE